MSVQMKRMNWMRSPTVWEQTQAWNKQRSVNRAHYERANTQALAAFGNAFTSQINGAGELALQMAVKRVQAATDAKFQELQKQLDSFA